MVEGDHPPAFDDGPAPTFGDEVCCPFAPKCLRLDAELSTHFDPYSLVHIGPRCHVQDLRCTFIANDGIRPNALRDVRNEKCRP